MGRGGAWGARGSVLTSPDPTVLTNLLQGADWPSFRQPRPVETQTVNRWIAWSFKQELKAKGGQSLRVSAPSSRTGSSELADREEWGLSELSESTTLG